MSAAGLRPYLVERIAEQADGCWLWTGHIDRDGYGKASINNRKIGSAHRVVYEALVGPIPAGLQLDHLCRVRACVNPQHLEPVTTRENLLRGRGTQAFINSTKTHCKRGHEFTPENTRLQRNRDGGVSRVCRQCAVLKAQERNRQLKQQRQERRQQRRGAA